MNTLLFLLLLSFGTVYFSIFFLQKYFRRKQQDRLKIAVEDALKILFQCKKTEQTALRSSLSTELSLCEKDTDLLLQELSNQQLASEQDTEVLLTKKGEERALGIIRAHRLYEQYLAEKTSLDPESWHNLAHTSEHTLTPESIARLSTELGNPTHDPHGDPIPSATGELHYEQRLSFANAPVLTSYKILHIEDEPAEYSKPLLQIPLFAGMFISISRKTPTHVWISVEGQEYEVPLHSLKNISVTPTPSLDPTTSYERLNSLNMHENATVTGISYACPIPQRRRLMDLGFVRGTSVAIAMKSPLQEPTAYLIRNTLIALHNDQAKHVFISREKDKGTFNG
jgi:DtxR family Mn-dependent transcriptional regulator